MRKLIRFGVSIEPNLIKRFDRLIGERGYTNRSEALRDLMRRELVAEEWRLGNRHTVGTLTILYDHSSKEVDRDLTRIQHDEHEHIVSSLHVHLDQERCLEVVVLRGKARTIKHLADVLLSSRGVKHGHLVMTTRGRGLT